MLNHAGKQNRKPVPWSMWGIHQRLMMAGLPEQMQPERWQHYAEHHPRSWQYKT
jgi:hypothetical protein